jgi:hypothetical protein
VSGDTCATLCKGVYIFVLGLWESMTDLPTKSCIYGMEPWRARFCWNQVLTIHHFLRESPTPSSCITLFTGQRSGSSVFVTWVHRQTAGSLSLINVPPSTLTPSPHRATSTALSLH